jgi:hypothetical protein
MPTSISPHAMGDSRDATRDPRDKTQHFREDPHFIAEYLAQNSSKAAAVFRRYDKLAMYRIIGLSKELRALEHQHDEIVEAGRNLEEPDVYGDYEARVGVTIKEYCTRSIEYLLSRASLTEGTDDLLNAYSQVLHLEPPAGRTVEALDRYIASPYLHKNQEWWAHRLRYRVGISKRD